MRDRDGFVFVFSICDRASYNGLQQFYDQLQSLYESNQQPPIILIGNKSDLSISRQIHIRDAELLAQKYHNCTYIETSAKNGSNIEQAFEILIRNIRKYKSTQPISSKSVPVVEQQGSCCIIN